MKCSYVICANEGRYIDEDGKIVCALCPLKNGTDSILIANVPKLLAWCRNALAEREVMWLELQNIVQRDPHRKDREIAKALVEREATIQMDREATKALNAARDRR